MLCGASPQIPSGYAQQGARLKVFLDTQILQTYTFRDLRGCMIVQISAPMNRALRNKNLPHLCA